MLDASIIVFTTWPTPNMQALSASGYAALLAETWDVAGTDTRAASSVLHRLQDFGCCQPVDGEHLFVRTVAMLVMPRAQAMLLVIHMPIPLRKDQSLHVQGMLSQQWEE